jgi:hypothetical protein
LLSLQDPDVCRPRVALQRMDVRVGVGAQE